MNFPVSIKGVLVEAGRVVLLENERNEWELPGGRLEPGEAPETFVTKAIPTSLARWSAGPGGHRCRHDAVARALRAATGTIPIVWIGGDPIQAGLAASLARPEDNITGVTVNAGDEIWGKRLQILKEVVPSASRIVYLTRSAGTQSRTKIAASLRPICW